jgi:hypothetical protein
MILSCLMEFFLLFYNLCARVRRPSHEAVLTYVAFFYGTGGVPPTYFNILKKSYLQNKKKRANQTKSLSHDSISEDREIFAL